MKKNLFLLTAFSFLQGSILLATPYTESEKIDMLIESVRSYNGAVFIRNGSEYSAKEAAEHLQMKREKAGSRVKTAQDFIDKIASRSYLSGKNYLIRKPDGTTVKSSDFLYQKLREIEAKNR